MPLKTQNSPLEEATRKILDIVIDTASAELLRCHLKFILHHSREAILPASTLFLTHEEVSSTKDGLNNKGEGTEVDDEGDFWAYYDEDTYGLVDIEEMKEDLPEGSKYLCCDGDRNAEGGESGKHVESSVKLAKH
ncbi:MAG: hypothetical protein M1827_005237 [Pycnora praestabilis]|nr:MAG: hypothetical protein M1827_005237 [Pycnora praestabilis]